ncbi:ATP-binding protein [Uliginosibacterium sp. H1]|uniref:ATP-binding protein n=1 Tax=Uliginosibacterium sp. H1 TaxID=3114757 RepID=UPI002E17ED2B|nr:ATP-binding protein [Uliginosibacterium sp. H1]
MSQPTSPSAPVTLDNCDREPIHIPGSIQPHGALIAFSVDGLVAWHTSNAATLLDCPVTLGTSLDECHSPLWSQVCGFVREHLPDSRTGEQYAVSHELDVAGRKMDVVINISTSGVIVEFEPRERDEDVSRFALQAHRALDRLKRTSSLQQLLERAVEEIRSLTGFDRVMAYRFRHDDSGDIVAESKADALESLLGRRYPASDIPAQARRLYVLNTLRLIADVSATPLALTGQADAAPLDLSHAVLRSVSPIHIEYLRNMGVGASMSVSVVIDGRLWGMFACHHMSRRLVPYAIRMAVDVMAQVVATTISSLLARQHAERTRGALAVQTDCAQSISDNDDVAEALACHLPTLARLLDADAAVVISGGKLAQHGLARSEAVADLARVLKDMPTQSRPLWNALADWSVERPASLSAYCGLLAHCFDAAAHAWLVFLRKEQIETVRWGGKPEKVFTVGPQGPRLTPRGSFDEWRETVEDTSVPWTDSDIEIAAGWADEMRRAAFVHHADTERARAHLMAVLGHDLRDPLHSISLAARVLEKVPAAGGAAIGERIQRTAGRMQRLVGLVLDMSKLRGGLGLGLNYQPLDLVSLVRQIMDEREQVQLDARYEVSLHGDAQMEGDPDRLAQVVTNLLGNARHHGQPGTPIRIQLAAIDDHILLTVRNQAPPIPDELLPQLFDPFKKSSLGNQRNAGGLGLGLYIAHQIAVEHGGSLSYRYEAPEVVFELSVPRRALSSRADPPQP